MSKEVALDPAAAPAPAAGKKGKLLMLAALVLLAAAGGGGAWWWTQKGKDAAHAADAPKKVAPKPRVFAPLDPFTVNLRTTDTEHYLQIGIVFETTGNEVADAIKAGMPLIRSKILYLLTSKTADELATTEGKVKLASELLVLARQALAAAPLPAETGPERGVTDVHFASMIIQ